MDVVLLIVGHGESWRSERPLNVCMTLLEVQRYAGGLCRFGVFDSWRETLLFISFEH